MNMGGHNHGGGMTMGVGMFQTTNVALAQSFWYIIVGVVGLLGAIRAVNYFQNIQRLRACRTESTTSPTVPTNAFSQAWATATAIVREASHPQFFVPFAGFRWLTPPSMGKIIILLCYWAVIVGMMVDGAIVKDAYFWERIGFRNAWVTMMQMPLLYLLTMKFNVLGFIIGTSHERLNWLHRWVARTMFVTATVHGWHFYTEWVRADFVERQLKMMPIIKYGFGAWAILLWTNLSGMRPFRQMAYEVFVIQHILSFVFFIWLVSVHIPTYAAPYLWFSIAALAFDRLARWSILAWQNLRFKSNPSGCNGTKRFGHDAQVRAVGSSTTVLTIKDVHFSWTAGQHLYLWLPAVGPLEAHPYTIACAHKLPETCICNSIQLVIRSHSGFSKRLHDFAQKMQASGQKKRLTAFVSGPYGTPPRWDVYETMILISASTGASFTMPILESILQHKEKMCTKRIDFVLMACQGEEIEFYVQRLREAVVQARETGMELHVHIAVTRSGGAEGNTDVSLQSWSDSSSSQGVEKRPGHSGGDVEKSTMAAESTSNQAGSDSLSRAGTGIDGIHQYSSRPDIAAIIREPVEAAAGETAVVVCGGQSLTSKVRNCVAKLSDERAVHKGTGAQGIYLFVEEYAF